MKIIHAIRTAEHALAGLPADRFFPGELDGFLGCLTAHRRALVDLGGPVLSPELAVDSTSPVDLLAAVENEMAAMLEAELSIADRRTIAGARFGLEAIRLAVEVALEDGHVRYVALE